MLIKGTTVIEKKMCYISHVKNVVVVTRGMCKRDFCYRFAQERILLQSCTTEIFGQRVAERTFQEKNVFCQRVVQKSFSCLRVLQERVMLLFP